MGIVGLLPLLKEIQVARNIADFKGKRLAVDAYVWLHKGAFGCAEDLVKGKKTTRFVDYAMYRIRMLRYHGITPFVVFDGGPLPAKRVTEDAREKSRADSLARAQVFEAQGRWKEARDCYTKCLDISPEMAYQLIKALRAEGVDYIVAPYEADAQLCFLEREGFVDGIITEDSDLLVFGCKTVIFKLDKDGSCVSIDRSRFATLRDLPMHGWTDLQFRRMAMLSGCDYLPSIPGIGLKKAHRMLRRYKTVEKLLQGIRLEGTHTIPPNYLEAFQQAELAFVHQRVFCPEKRCLVPLTPFPPKGLAADDEKWIGVNVSVEEARGMASGELHPETRKPINDLWPDFQPSPKAGSSKPGQSSKPAGLFAPGKRGTLDTFFTRVKRTKSTPAVQPVGEMTSGVKRLSDLSTGLGRYHSEPTPPPTTAPKLSKFFSKGKGKEPAPLPETQETQFSLHWEESDAVPTQVDRESTRSPSPVPVLSSPIRVGSLSPAVSATPRMLAQTPSRSSPIRAERNPFSSPFSHVSSPPTATPPDSLDRALDARFSDLDAATTRPEPSSPTPSRVLVAASSTEILASTPRGYTHISTSQMATVASSPSITPIQKGSMRRLSSILVPDSSPSMNTAAPTVATKSSSDSIMDDDIVTPPADNVPRRALKKRLREAEDDDPVGKAKARVVSESWSTRWSLGSQTSSPAPRNRRQSAPISSGGRALTNKKTVQSGLFRPLSYSDLPKSQPQHSSPHITPKAAPAPKAVPASASQPHGLSLSALERFRYARR